MNGLKQAHFELEKIKFLKGEKGVLKGVEIIFNALKEKDGKPDNFRKESDNYPHPDLIASITNLKDCLVKSIGKETIVTERLIAGYKKLFKREADYKELEGAIEAHHLGELSKISVNGVAISGIDTNRGAVIMGTYECKNGSKIALNSPRIRFEGESLGIEQEVQELCTVVEVEAWEYAINDKQAQQQIVFDEGKE